MSERATAGEGQIGSLAVAQPIDVHARDRWEWDTNRRERRTAETSTPAVVAAGALASGRRSRGSTVV